MGTPAESTREPCPHRIIDDAGGAFEVGLLGGSVFHFLKGIYNSPKGFRLSSGSQAVVMNAPRLAGWFGAWGAIYSTVDCALVYTRHKEDPWNSIIACAATGGFLNIRRGLGYSARATALGGFLMALVEGSGFVFNRYLHGVEVGHISDHAPPGATTARLLTHPHYLRYDDRDPNN